MSKRAHVAPFRSPVQYRHEIVADNLDAGASEIAQRLLVCRDVLAPVAILLLDVLADGEAFNDVPAQCRRLTVRSVRDLLLAQRDFLRTPYDAIRQVMQSRDNAEGS